MPHPSKANKRAWKWALQENILRDLQRLLGLDPGLLECKFEFEFPAHPHGPMSALQFACDSDWQEASLWLIEQGARPSGLLKSKRSALAFAVAGCDLAVVESLLDAGSNDFDVVSVFGNNPLHDAVEAEEDDIVKALLDAGADPMVKNDKGLTALDLARKSGSQELMDIMRPALANEQGQTLAASTPSAKSTSRRKGL